MNAKHNGYQNISSQILIMNVDGSEKQELTKPESMTMNPTASFEAGKIVYNTIDGRLYQMNISLK
jgi:Tol biopolymer transport system component